MIPPILVLGIGNRLRGDDALGPCLVERAQQALGQAVMAGQVEFMIDVQLQVEHVFELEGRRCVVFVDASVQTPAPWSFERVEDWHEPMAMSTHAMSPAALLEVYRALWGKPPMAWVLGIRAERFELGEELSFAAEKRLGDALVLLVNKLPELLGSTDDASARGSGQSQECLPTDRGE